jgi:hypothetical protein
MRNDAGLRWPRVLPPRGASPGGAVLRTLRDPLLLLPHVGYGEGRANKAVPARWIRRIVDARFAMQ